MNIYRGDLLPALVITLTDGGTPINLTTATAIRVIGSMGGSVQFSDNTLTGTSGGVITRQWVTADTDTVGTIDIEVELTWPGNKPQTIRPSDTVVVLADLG